MADVASAPVKEKSALEKEIVELKASIAAVTRHEEAERQHKINKTWMLSHLTPGNWDALALGVGDGRILCIQLVDEFLEVFFNTT